MWEEPRFGDVPRDRRPVVTEKLCINTTHCAWASTYRDPEVASRVGWALSDMPIEECIQAVQHVDDACLFSKVFCEECVAGRGRDDGAGEDRLGVQPEQDSCVTGGLLFGAFCPKNGWPVRGFP